MTQNYQEVNNQLLELYFAQPNILYEHLFSSYHQFVGEMIPHLLMNENNFFYENVDKEKIYIHGFKCSNIRIKPSTFDNDNEIKFPSDARKNHLNYFGSVIVDIQQFVEIINAITGEKKIHNVGELEKEIPIGNIPIMIKSKYCSTYIKQDLKGECKFDPGGEFIINGQGKVIMSIEKIVDNKILIFSKKDPSFENNLQYIAQINSKANDWSDNLQILTIKQRKNGVIALNTSSQLVDIPLFILLKALGVESDMSIISYITHDLEDIKMINLLRPSVSNCVDDLNEPIKTKEEAIEYLITKLRRNKRISSDENIAKIQKRLYLDKILRQDLLPHLGEDIPKKIVFLSFMTNKLLNVILGNNDIDDRDALHNKRVETPGILLGQLFRQNWKKLLNEIGKNFKKKNQSDETPINVINQIKPAVIEQGIKTALATGVWGMNKTKKGVAQALQRLSWIQGISYLRRIMSPSMEESTSKVTSIRKANNNQTQMLCLTGDTEILLDDNTTIKQIIDISDGESVITYHPEKLTETTSIIYNKFGKMPDKLYQIDTDTNRSIKATPEHKFLVLNNGKPEWKKTVDITSKDLILIRPTEKLLIDNKIVNIAIDKNKIKEVHMSYIPKLEAAGYFNNISHDKLLIIARLIGLIHGYKRDFNIHGFLFNLDSIEDLEYFISDIIKLNIDNKDSIQILARDNIFRVRLNDILSFVIGYFGELDSYYNIMVPSWIMDSNKLIKREYLAGYKTASEINIQYEDITKINVSMVLYKELDSVLYLNRVSNLLNEFEIEHSIHPITDKGVNYGMGLVIKNNISNLVKYNDTFDYRYSKKLKHDSIITNEYLRTIIEEFQTDCVVRKSKYTYNDFLNNKLHDGYIAVPVREVKEIKPEMVYDFTTISSNHSFVASSFCSSNCPVETPEGAKIGIVKSLAMTSTITMQNSSQHNIIKTILNNNTHIKHPYDIDPLTMNQYIKVLLNGDWVGVANLDYSYEILNMLKKHRRDGIIDKYTSILLDTTNKEIRVYYDGGRLIRPLLIVKDNKVNYKKEFIDDINSEINSKNKSKSWKKILSKYPDIVEYEDVDSLNYLLVADEESKLNEAFEASIRKVEYKDNTMINRYGDYKWVNYTHSDFNQWTLFGSVSANIPFANHNYGTRNIIHFSQAKQSIGIYLSSYKDRMDISQILYNPQVPIVQTQGMKYNGCLDLPFGENAIVAICSYTGYNQEDSLIFNQSAIDRGFFRADTLKKESSVIEKNPSTSQDDIFTKPDRNKVVGMKQGSYEKLNDKGYVPEETEIENEDIIIGKISPMQPTGKNNKVYKDSSKIFKSNIPGVIDRVHTGVYNSEGYEMYNMRIRLERKPIIGDKFTNRHAQKGTIGIVYPQKDMPFTESGMVPDLILNPHAFPSRMSVAHFIETLAAKQGAEKGEFVDGTPFNNYDIMSLPKAMKELGYSPYGTETMYCGITGRKMDAEIFIGPSYNIRLKHMVQDKVHGRARGPKQSLTRQPLEGRSKDGGLKIGEMEKDAMVAHGMGQFTKERLMETSDIAKFYVCDDCGQFASKVIDKEYYKCKGCQNSTRISAVVIPYACKLLFQELMAVNILPRIRTEKPENLE